MKEYYKLIKEYPNRKIGDVAIYIDNMLFWDDFIKYGHRYLINNSFLENGWFEKINESKFNVGDWIASIHNGNMFDIHQVCDIHDHAYEFTNGEQYSRKNADNPYNARLANLEEIFNYIKEKYKRNDCIFIGNDAIVAKLKSINQIGIKYTPVEKLKSLKFCSIKQNMPIIRKATQIETDSYFKILSKTDDGVDLRKYDEVYYVDCELELYLDLNIQEIEYGCKYFHTKENAEKYLEENRTLFSLQEVINELNFHSKEAAISNLQIIAKNKIKKNA